MKQSLSAGFWVVLVHRQCSYPVGINTGPSGEGRRRHAEASRHQVLVSVHQVVQVLFIQKALEELAVIGAGQLHAVVTLRNRGQNRIFR